MKTVPAMSGSPVTTSASETDIQGSYQHDENCYITKPVDLEEFLKVVRSIDSFLVVGG
jgi:chemotaxis family two-component system response regulator Rcp1